jgi:anti-sigma B factor antagonist
VSAVELIGEAPAAFEVGVEPAREVVRVKPVGELDLATVSVLEEQVRELLAVGFEQLIIDLRGLSFIDVSGLRLLLSLARDARHEGWRLSLIQGSVPVRRLFALTDTAHRLPFSPVATEPDPDKHLTLLERRDRAPLAGDGAGVRHVRIFTFHELS